MTVGFAALLVVRRQWTLLACLASVATFLVATPQLMPWHALSLWPLVLLAAAPSEPGLHTELASVALLWMMAVGISILQAGYYPGWIGTVLTQLTKR